MSGVSAELTATAAEIEAHLASAGWDRPPALFALVRAGQFRKDDPLAAARVGLDDVDDDALTPIEQEELPEGPLDEVLAQIAWPDAVVGCALSQEIVVLPPAAEEHLSDDEIASRAPEHPHRREARLVVAVLRGSDAAAVMRMRGENEQDVLTGPDLAPNLARALHATFD